MRRLICVILFFIVGFSSVKAQESFKEVDSTTFSMYSNKKWVSLADYGEKAIEKGYDYFYINVRVGIAYFNLKEYKKSKLYLERANQENSYNNIAIEYLFWNNYHLLKEKEALKWYEKLDDTIQKRINYIPLKTVTSVYTEGGRKFSNDVSVAESVNYFNAALKFHFSGKFELLQSYTSSNQKLNWGNFTQHQLYLNPSFLINKKLKLNIGVHLAQYNSQLDYNWRGFYQSSNSSSVNTSVPNPFPLPGSTMTTITTVTDSLVNMDYNLVGSYKEKDILIEPRITKQWKNVTFSPYFSYYYSLQKPNYNEIYLDTVEVTITEEQVVISQNTSVLKSVSIPKNDFYQQLGIGGEVYYNYKFLTVGFDTKFISNTSSKFLFFSPFLKLDIGKKVHLSSYYFKKKSYAIGLFESSQLINSFDNVKKFSLSTSFDVTKKVSCYFTFQNEKITDRVSLKEYKLNSIYFGIKLKL